MYTDKLIFFDCDSTLSAIEGIDELGRLRGAEVFAAVEAMTHQAMDGKIPVESVFGRRLEIIRPTQADVAAIGARYIETIEPTAMLALNELRRKGWTPLILSGGFRQAIRPLADHLGVADVEAVDLFFDAKGDYAGFAKDYPTTRSGGKPEVIRKWIDRLQPKQIVMVGDGVSDLETKTSVTKFIGFGRYVARERVKREAEAFAMALAEVPALVD